MTNKFDNASPPANKLYLTVVFILTFLLAAVCTFIQVCLNGYHSFTFELFGKWFIFSAVGLRLFIAGIKQAVDPAFTAKQIFHIEGIDIFPIVRELGFANICLGLVGIISLFMPQWRVVSAFASGLYYGIAGLQHLFKKPAGINEMVALITDILIFVFLLAYFLIKI